MRAVVASHIPTVFIAGLVTIPFAALELFNQREHAFPVILFAFLFLLAFAVAGMVKTIRRTDPMGLNAIKFVLIAGLAVHGSC